MLSDSLVGNLDFPALFDVTIGRAIGGADHLILPGLRPFGLGGSQFAYIETVARFVFSSQVNNSCHDGVLRIGGCSTCKIEVKGSFSN